MIVAGILDSGLYLAGCKLRLPAAECAIANSITILAMR
jgi:hypothetical protein